MAEAAPPWVERIIHVGVVIALKDNGAVAKVWLDFAYGRRMAVALPPLVRRYVIYNFTNE
ncbi:MAG: hypothetical protein QOH24_1069 [Verrucomicrobiota bacterium]